MSYVCLAVCFLFCISVSATAFSRPNPLFSGVVNALQQRSLAQREAIISQVEYSPADQSYYTVATAGNISFRLSLDTGSSDILIVSSACDTSVCQKLPKYPLTYPSPSFLPINDNATFFNVSFADGTSASGFVAQEAIAVQGLTAANQTFGLVNQTTLTLGDDISGVLGLGFTRLSTFSPLTNGSLTFIGNLAAEGLLDYPIIGLSLPPPYNGTGSLTLGAIDSAVVTNVSKIEFHEVVPFAPFLSENSTAASYLQWTIRLSKIYVNGSTVIPQPTYPNITKESLALFDIGNNGILGPYQDVSRIFDLFPESRLVDESGTWALPCDTNEVISISFGGANFTLQPTDYIIGIAEGDPSLCLVWPRATLPSNDGIDWHFGTAFLHTVYSVFSYGINKKEPPMIGLYQLTNVSTITQSPANISSILAMESATIETTLPNFLIPVPTPTPSAYIFNTSITATPGLLVSTGLATSTYSPILAAAVVNASALPTISPSSDEQTVTITNSEGQVTTTTTPIPQPTVILGEPPGYNNSGISSSMPNFGRFLSCLLALFIIRFS